MYSNEITKILGRNAATHDYFIGCYAGDQIPTQYPLFPHCFVVNMDCSGWEGSHWVAIFVQSKTRVEYYDSLGDWPPISPYIIEYLDQFSNVEYNYKQIQSEHSKTCGQHAIHFLCMRCSGSIANICDMVKYFNKSNRKPDAIVTTYVRRLMDI